MEDIIEQGIKYRICYVCRRKLVLTTDNFYKNKTKKEGFELCCKRCSSKRISKYNKSKPKKSEQEKKDYNNYRNEWRNQQKDKGLCRVCKNPHLPNSTLCEEHYFCDASRRHLGTSTRWKELKGLWESQNHKCAYSGRILTLGLDDGIDHIKPLSKHPELLNNIDNLQYIHRKINFFKQDFEEKEFLDFVRDIKNNLNL